MVDFATIARMIRLPEGLSRVWVQPTLADWWIMLALAEPETNKQLSLNRPEYFGDSLS